MTFSLIGTMPQGRPAKCNSVAIMMVVDYDDNDMNMMMLKMVLITTFEVPPSGSRPKCRPDASQCGRGELAPDQASPNPIPSLHQPSQAPRSPQRPRSSQARRPPQATRSVHPARQTLPPGRAPPPPQRRVLLPTPVWVLPTSTSSLQMSTCHR